MASRIVTEGSIGQYELEQLIGQDAFADKYIAYDSESNRHVLISALGEQYAGNANFRKQYTERSRALSRIRHPNIAIIYETGETPDKQPYVATEQFEGFPLSDRLRRLAKQQSPAHVIYALTLVRQIASGLSLAERLGYFHYELTPRHIFLRNVTLKADDSAVLVNLDIPPEFTLESSPGDDAYNRSYISPEQLSHKGIDGRSHVYSLGTILFHLLTGKLPAKEKSNWQHPFRPLSSAGFALQELRDDLSPETYALVDKSARIRPGSRFGSIGEFVAALDQALAAEDLRIHTSNLAEPRRPRPIYLAPLLLLLICISLAAAIWWVSPGNSDSESPIVVNSENPSVAMEGSISSSLTPTMTLNEKDQITSPASAKTNAENLAPSPSALPSHTTSAIKPTTFGSLASTPIRETQPTNTPANTLTNTPTDLPPTASLPTATQIIPTPWPQFRISASSASLRQGPGTRYGVGSYLFEDEEVIIIGKTNRSEIWYVVRTTDGRIGWISASVGESAGITDLDTVAEAATIPAPPPTFTPTPTSTPLPTDTPESPLESGGNGNDQEDKPRPRSTPTPPL